MVKAIFTPIYEMKSIWFATNHDYYRLIVKREKNFNLCHANFQRALTNPLSTNSGVSPVPSISALLFGWFGGRVPNNLFRLNRIGIYTTMWRHQWHLYPILQHIKYVYPIKYINIYQYFYFIFYNKNGSASTWQAFQSQCIGDCYKIVCQFQMFSYRIY